ncbi:MAG: Uma2 family endonuclease [Acidobacteria bacterium]|nr:Uma2 family endonuclease [Acidobacteriota bacterium]
MSTRPAPHTFSVEEFHLMGSAGIFTEDDRVELLDGQIVDMSPIGSRHAGTVKRLIGLLAAAVAGRAIVSVQDPVLVGPRSEPEPDVVLLRPRDDFYCGAHPGPGDVLLLIEVVDTTVLFDRNVKVPLYARGAVPEVWIVDLPSGVVETYRAPGPDGYRETARAGRGETVSPRALPDIVLRVEEIAG